MAWEEDDAYTNNSWSWMQIQARAMLNYASFLILSLSLSIIISMYYASYANGD